MLEVALLVVGFLLTAFVGYNIGGSTTGPAFGPAVGADAISKSMAAGLMAVFFGIGAWTIGPEVVDTLVNKLAVDTDAFTLASSVAVLGFIGGSLFLGNVVGVPTSTSMTAVGAIGAMLFAADALNQSVLGGIVMWWIVAPIVGFWVSGVIGRYFYAHLNRWIAVESTEGALLELDRSQTIPRVRRGPNTTSRELAGSVLVVAIGCLMAYASGTSNIANAIAPLVASEAVDLNPAVLLGSAAVAVGAFTIARRTLDTLGNDLTQLPLTAAIVVATVSSVLVTGLSAIGIPASFVIIATMSIIGLGWGRATRTTTVRGVRNEQPGMSPGALAGDEPGEELPAIGEEDPRDLPTAADLFDPSTTARVILMQNVVPVLATVGAYLTFRFVPVFGF